MTDTTVPPHGIPGLPADLVEAYRRHGDELADRTVASVFTHGGLPGVARLLNEIIDRDHLLPDDEHHRHGPGYGEYLSESLCAPDSLDLATLDKSIDWFETYGWTAFSILGCASLPEGYAVAEVSAVLGTTQALTDHTQRRLWETIQFVLDVMEPNGLVVDPNNQGVMQGPGALRAQKVRLFHATIRFLLQFDDGSAVRAHRAEQPMDYGDHLLDHTWDEPRFGTPINQAQMSGTVLSFSWIILRGLFTLGYQDEISDDMARAYLYRWNVVGHLMGVTPELMVETVEHAEALFNHLRRPDLTPDGRALMQALMDFMYGQVPALLGFLRPTAPMLVVFLIGEEHAHQVGLELTRSQRLFFGPLKLMMKAWSAFYGHERVMQGISRWLYRTMSRNMIGKGRSGPRVFRLPTSAAPSRWLRG